MSDDKDTPVTETDLAALDDAFERADADDDAFESVPDGRYQAVVDRIELVRTQNGDPMLKWTLRILGPTHANRLLWRYNVLSSDENVKWLKKDLLRCGVQLTRLSELPANLERLLDLRLDINKKTKGDFESVYIDRRVRTAGEAESPQAPASATAAKPRGKAKEALKKF